MIADSADSKAPDGRPAETQPLWRRDFPIDIPQDQYVARRDFTKFLVLTSFAFVVGQFSIVLQSVFGGHKAAPAPLALGRLDAIPVGGVISFNFPGPNDPCLLLRLDTSTLVAYSQKCTHLSCAVIPQLDRARLFCPCHEGAFELTDGRPIAGPPRRPLRSVPLEVRDGIVYAVNG